MQLWGFGVAGEISRQDSAVAALMAFEPRAAALVLEEEVREALIGSLSAAVGARPLG